MLKKLGFEHFHLLRRVVGGATLDLTLRTLSQLISQCSKVPSPFLSACECCDLDTFESGLSISRSGSYPSVIN